VKLLDESDVNVRLDVRQVEVDVWDGIDSTRRGPKRSGGRSVLGLPRNDGPARDSQLWKNIRTVPRRHFEIRNHYFCYSTQNTRTFTLTYKRWFYCISW
jgi:hypothetical protein